MDGILARNLMALLAMLAALFAAPPLLAQDTEPMFAPGSVCLAEAPGATTYADIARRSEVWNCGKGELENLDRVALRFDLRDLAPSAPAPDHLQLTRVHFEQMVALVIAKDGSTAQRTLDREDLLPGHTLREAAIELPQTGARPLAIVLMVEGAPSVEHLRLAEPVVGPPMKPIAGSEHLLAALLCGLLLAPLFFDIGFFRTLRKPFPLYHGAFCLLAVIQTATLSGLILLLADFSLATQRALSILSFDLMVAASCLFIASFVERGILEARHHRLLYAMAGLTTALGLFASFALPLFGAATATIYYAGYLFYLAGLAVVLTRALRMGSRAILFVLLAHLPLLLVGIARVVVGLVAPVDYVLDTYWLQNLALAFEVVVTAYAVTDRFLKIKQQRDRARAQQIALEDLATRDPLTGLLNRRAVDEQFSDLHRAGYDTFALIDLDHFKSINDACGHQAGDAALRAVGKALQVDPETISIRLGARNSWSCCADPMPANAPRNCGNPSPSA